MKIKIGKTYRQLPGYTPLTSAESRRAMWKATQALNNQRLEVVPLKHRRWKYWSSQTQKHLAKLLKSRPPHL